MFFVLKKNWKKLFRPKKIIFLKIFGFFLWAIFFLWAEFFFFFGKKIFFCSKKNFGRKVFFVLKKNWKKLFRPKKIIFLKIFGFFCGRFFFFVGEIFFFLEKKFFFVRKKISGEKCFLF